MGMGEGAGTFNSPSSAILRHRRRPSPSPSSGPGTGAQLSTPAPAANAACSAQSGPLHLPFPAPPAGFWTQPQPLPPQPNPAPARLWPVCQTGRPGGSVPPEGSRGPRGHGKGGGPEAPGGGGFATPGLRRDELLGSQRYLEYGEKVSGRAKSQRNGGGGSEVGGNTLSSLSTSLTI